MKYLLSFLLIAFLSCNSSNPQNENDTNQNLPYPEQVNPPEDAIPQDMHIQNDSVIMTDSNAVRESATY